jgi:hypothetical protein
MTFQIDTDSQITILDAPPAEPAPDGVLVFTTSKELTQAAMEWPYARLVDIWNRLAPRVGLRQVNKFENRQKAIVRIWRAAELLAEKNAGGDTTTTMQQLKDLDAERAGKRECAKALKEQATAAVEAPAEIAACAAPRKTKKAAKAAKAPKAERAPKAKKAPKLAGEPKAPREGTAKATVLAMIQRKGGATLQEIMDATGWQAHTCRGFMSVAPKKAGLTVTSTRRESDKARVYEAK